jgi:extracellular factor (EF) 3-hydroxypalmitic acid methyl ester biosynthesis protein
VARANPGSTVLVTNVHSSNPQRVLMEHLLEWHLIYRDEAQLESLLPAARTNTNVYTDETGANVIADFQTYP